MPERYRAAVVLCYLEGQTCESAARQLGWPVGTVKSRLARGRKRLLGRLIHRGLGPDVAPDRSSAPALVSGGLMRKTSQAMFRFAVRQPMVDLVSARVLSLTLNTLRTIQMTRLSLIFALGIAGLAATGVAVLAIQEPAPSGLAVPGQAAAVKPARSQPAAMAKKVEMVPVSVVNTSGQGVPNVEVEVFDQIFGGVGPRFRTGVDGRVVIPIDPDADPSYGIHFLARPDGQTLGWGTGPAGHRRRVLTSLRSRSFCSLELIRLKVQLWIRPASQSVEYRSGCYLSRIRVIRVFWTSDLLRGSRSWAPPSRMTPAGTP